MSIIEKLQAESNNINAVKKEGFNYSENRLNYRSGVVSIYW